jgi:hypothetical protein
VDARLDDQNLTGKDNDNGRQVTSVLTGQDRLSIVERTSQDKRLPVDLSGSSSRQLSRAQ